MKVSGKKRVLTLNRETLQSLDQDLTGVAGGVSHYGEVCNTTSTRSVGDCTGYCPSYFTCAPDCIIYVRPALNTP
jgi:hypothetical protein